MDKGVSQKESDCIMAESVSARNYGDIDQSPILRLVDEKVRRVEDLHKSDIQRVDEKQASNFEYLKQSMEDGFKHLEDLMKVNFENTKLTAESESRRIDNLRIVDTQAVVTANEKAIKTAEIIATQVVESSKTMGERIDVITNSLTSQIQQISLQLTERLAAVEKVQYEDKGRYGNASELQNQIKELQDSRSENKGRAGISTSVLVVFVGAIASILGAIVVRVMMGL